MSFAKSLRKSAPAILSLLAGAGVIFTAISAAKATPEAMRRVESVSEEKKRPLTKKETFKTTWSCYKSTYAFGAGTIACIIAANILNQKEQASLTGAYVLLKQTHGDYISKIKEKFGKEVHEEIMNEIVAEKAEDVKIYTDNICDDCSTDFEGIMEDTCLFYDSFSNRYFEATPMQVIQAEYHLNRNFVLGMEPTVNDFYDLLGLEHTDIGKVLMWSGLNGDYFWIDFNHFKTKYTDNLECFVIECSGITSPSTDFLNET